VPLARNVGVALLGEVFQTLMEDLPAIKVLLYRPTFENEEGLKIVTTDNIQDIHPPHIIGAAEEIANNKKKYQFAYIIERVMKVKIFDFLWDHVMESSGDYFDFSKYPPQNGNTINRMLIFLKRFSKVLDRLANSSTKESQANAAKMIRNCDVDVRDPAVIKEVQRRWRYVQHRLDATYRLKRVTLLLNLIRLRAIMLGKIDKGSSTEQKVLGGVMSGVFAALSWALNQQNND